MREFNDDIIRAINEMDIANPWAKSELERRLAFGGYIKGGLKYPHDNRHSGSEIYRKGLDGKCGDAFIFDDFIKEDYDD